MQAKFGALLTVVIGWVFAIGLFMFLRTFESPVIMWLFVLVVLAFLPRETYRVWKLFTAPSNEE